MRSALSATSQFRNRWIRALTLLFSKRWSSTRHCSEFSRHNAVLDRENSEQCRVDDQRFEKRSVSARIHRFRNCDVADKADRIKKRSEENQVTNYSIRK